MYRIVSTLCLYLEKVVLGKIQHCLPEHLLQLFYYFMARLENETNATFPKIIHLYFTLILVRKLSHLPRISYHKEINQTSVFDIVDIDCL